MAPIPGAVAIPQGPGSERHPLLLLPALVARGALEQQAPARIPGLPVHVRAAPLHEEAVLEDGIPGPGGAAEGARKPRVEELELLAPQADRAQALLPVPLPLRELALGQEALLGLGHELLPGHPPLEHVEAQLRVLRPAQRGGEEADLGAVRALGVAAWPPAEPAPGRELDGLRAAGARHLRPGRLPGRLPGLPLPLLCGGRGPAPRRWRPTGEPRAPTRHEAAAALGNLRVQMAAPEAVVDLAPGPGALQVRGRRLEVPQLGERVERAPGACRVARRRRRRGLADGGEQKAQRAEPARSLK